MCALLLSSENFEMEYMYKLKENTGICIENKCDQ